jgi:hypothetical protein
VSGIEEATQFVGLVEISVQFVQQESGLLLVNDAERCSPGALIFDVKRFMSNHASR